MSRCVLPALILALVFTASRAAAQGGRTDESVVYARFSTGTGARAWGMGGAQIAVGGESDAVTWNPAAIGALAGPYVAFSLLGDRVAGDLAPTTYRNPSTQFVGQVDTGSITPTLSRASGSTVDFVSAAFPFKVAGRGVVAGVAYDAHLSFSGDTDVTYQFRHQSMYTVDYDYAYVANATGGFRSASFSIASELLHGLTVGANVHRWFGGSSVASTESYAYSVANLYSWTGTYNEAFTDRVNLGVSALSADLGALIRFGKRYSAGFVYRGGFDADLSYSNAPTYRNDHTGVDETSASSGTSVLRMPWTIGAGAAVQATARLLVAVDAGTTRWSEAQIDAYARATAQGPAPATVPYAFPVMKPAGAIRQSDTGRVAVGAEYGLRLNAWTVPIRGGVFYQQQYVNDGSGGTWGAATGAGFRRGHLVADGAWVHDRAAGRYSRNSLRVSLGYSIGHQRRQP